MTTRRIVSILLSFVAVTAIGAWVVTAGVQTQDPKLPVAPHHQAKLPPMPFSKNDAMPLPAATVTQIFEFAAEHPEVLSYIPCFCGCEHLGHKGNEDCFVKARNADGDVVAWEPH